MRKTRSSSKVGGRESSATTRQGTIAAEKLKVQEQVHRELRSVTVIEVQTIRMNPTTGGTTGRSDPAASAVHRRPGTSHYA
jgi:hypothetical protein